MWDLEYLEGVDDRIAGRLKAGGIMSIQGLAEEGATSPGRLRIGLRSGLPKDLIQSLVSRAQRAISSS